MVFLKNVVDIRIERNQEEFQKKDKQKWIILPVIYDLYTNLYLYSENENKN